MTGGMAALARCQKLQWLANGAAPGPAVPCLAPLALKQSCLYVARFNICMYSTTYMPVITVRIDEETKRLMQAVQMNWSEFIRAAIRAKATEEKRKNIARAVLINERLRRATKGESPAEDIIRRSRDERHGKGSG